MPKPLLMALTAAALLSCGMLGNRADAMTPTAPSALGVADTGLVQKSAVVCGYYGCVRTTPRYYGAYYGRPYGYGRPYRRW
jgi:hypothetical protein